MPINSGIAHAPVAVGTTDTTILNPTAGRSVITHAVVHDTNGGAQTIEFFDSSDATSAAGERIGQVVLAANETKTPDFLRGLSIGKDRFLIAKASAAGANIKPTTTNYSGDS